MYARIVAEAARHKFFLAQTIGVGEGVPNFV